MGVMYVLVQIPLILVGLSLNTVLYVGMLIAVPSGLAITVAIDHWVFGPIRAKRARLDAQD